MTEVDAIVKKLQAKGLDVTADEEHFIARRTIGGKPVEMHFPQWKSIDLADGTSIRVEKDIERFFTSPENDENSG